MPRTHFFSKTTALSASIFLLFGLTVKINAQTMGNYNIQQEKSSNAVNVPNAYNAQYRAIPKAASLHDNNQVEISINALSNQKADSYLAIFNIIQVGKTVEETNNLLNQRIEAFVTDLKNNGIAAEDIHVDLVNFIPKYEYDVAKKAFSKKTYTEIPKGFELQKNIHIRYKKQAMLEKILSAAARQEIYDIIKVDYFIEKPQEVYAQLRDAAFLYLKKTKEQYRANGIHLDSAYLITAENAWVAYPGNRYESYQAFSSEPLDGYEKGAIINPADKPVARFYNAIPANDYDIVINPEILEPAIQFSYNLLLRFTLPPQTPSVKTVIKKEFVLVTPTGEVKTLKIEN